MFKVDTTTSNVEVININTIENNEDVYKYSSGVYKSFLSKIIKKGKRSVILINDLAIIKLTNTVTAFSNFENALLKGFKIEAGM